MFLSDEVLADASPAAAAARLAAFTRRTALVRASHSAWDTATASIGRAGTWPGLPRLTRVRCQGPVGQGTATMLILRWEAVDDSGLPFPALDADITLMPHGEHAVLIGLAGVYRTPSGARPAQPAVYTAAAAAIRALLTHIAGAVSDPAAVRTGAIRVAPAALESAAAMRAGELTLRDGRP